MRYQIYIRYIICGTFCCGCHIVFPMIHNIPKERNAHQFPGREVNKGDSVFSFIQPAADYRLGEKIILDEKSVNPHGEHLDMFSKLHHTISFMIIRNDTLLYESYREKYKDSSLVSGFSVAKSFVSTLVGIAIEEGKIKNVHQSITDFVPELKEKGFTPITVQHLLKHTSGIHYSQQLLNPNSDNAQLYYGKDLRRRMLDFYIKEQPGLHFDYQSENYQLLGLILERTTGHTLSKYLQEKIWTKIGMENNAFWNIDNETESRIEKAFCCLSASTHDFAKLGRLYLNKGNWNGKQVVPRKWIEEAIHPDTLVGGKINFQYNWIAGPQKYASYYAVGLYGQYVYVYPEKNIIIARFGKEDLNYNPSYWKTTFLQIIDQL